MEKRENLARQATLQAESRIRGEQREVSRAADGDVGTWWSTGPGNLAVDPVDVDVHLAEPRVIDTVVLVTTTIKNQLRGVRSTCTGA